MIKLKSLQKKQINEKKLMKRKKIPDMFDWNYTTSGDYAYIPGSLYKFCVLISSIKLWDKNPRKNASAVKPLADLIKSHGFRKPIVVNQDNIIMAGNTAYKAAKLLNMKYIPVAQSHFKSEASAVAYGISDNRSAENSSWDDNTLKQLMLNEPLESRNTFGFNQDELDLKLKKQMKITEKEINIEDFKFTNRCPKCHFEF